MSRSEILACARQAKQFGFGTIVIQAGEDPELSCDFIADVLRSIKAETGLAVTLSLGERDRETLRTWREAGADRYLLRFETSDKDLYRKIHPSHPEGYDRVEMLRELKHLGYEAGSGVMVGLPGQSFETLARDIELFGELDLDMIGIGPFIPHPATPLGAVDLASASDQVRATETMVLKAVALTRLICPESNIPSTTALATINRVDGREKGLQSGANVIMPNLTPAPYRHMYEIYRDKACADDDPGHCATCLKTRIKAIGRTVGAGAGFRRQQTCPVEILQ
jgi:biotin synthase